MEKILEIGGWSRLSDVADFINDMREIMNLSRTPHRMLCDLQFIFDDFGLLNGHDHEGHPLVTWINPLHYVVMGDKPKEPVEYEMGIHIPSGWVSHIKTALSRGVIKVINQKTDRGRGVFQNIVGIKSDGTSFDLILSSGKIYFLPPIR